MNTQRVRMNTQRGVTSRWGIPPNPIAGRSLQSSINPNPFFIRRGFRPLPKPLANLWQGDVVDSESWLSPSRFWYGSQSLCPFGASHDFFIGWRIVLQDAIIRVSLVYFLIYFLFDCLFEPLSNFIEPLSKGRRKQGCQKRIARPEGAKALRAIQKLCRRAVSARRQLHPFHIGKGLG